MYYKVKQALGLLIKFCLHLFTGLDFFNIFQLFTSVNTCFLLDKTSPVSSSDKALPERPKKSKLRRAAAAAAVYESLLRQAVEEDDDESDSNDETFEGGELNSSDEENVNGVDESSNDGGF